MWKSKLWKNRVEVFVFNYEIKIDACEKLFGFKSEIDFKLQKMETFTTRHHRHHRRKNFPVFPKMFTCSAILFAISLHCALSLVSAVPNPVNGPRFSPLLTPPQVLLPPHREEGQSLDDIIYGTSFSGSSLQNFPFLKSAPVEVPRPSVFSTSSPAPSPQATTIQSAGGNIQTQNAPVLPKPVVPPSQTPPSHAFSHNRNNINLVQTFTPPSNAPFKPSRPDFSPPIPASAEEIKVPQTVKHRTPQRKQYTKADLIAAANSIKPAGFDFSKVLIVTPSNNNSIYQQASFPLPLFDTPVYNQLRPLMEMLMKARYNLGGGSVSDSKKVLVIIPKGSGPHTSNLSSGQKANNVVFSNPLLSNNKPSVKHQLQSSATSTSSSKSSPTSKFAILPKSSPGKFATTAKPKSLGFTTTTTKRASKFGGTPTHHAAKATGRKPDKGQDLQAAATVNNKRKSNSIFL